MPTQGSDDHPSPSEETDTEDLVRVCRKCSTQSRTSGDYCPHCGASYLGRSGLGSIWGASKDRVRGLSPRSKKLLIGGAAILALVVAGGAVAAKIQSDNAAEARQEAAEKQAERERAAEEAAAQAQAEADAEEAAAEKELRKARRAAVRSLEKAVTGDAQEAVADGLLDGPIIRTECQAVGGGSTDDLVESTTKFECLAISEELSGGESRGYPYDATMNWDEGSYTWQLQD